MKGKGSRVWQGGHQSMMFLTRLHPPSKELQSNDCPLGESCIGQKWLDLCTSALLSHRLGATLRREWPQCESCQLIPLLAIKRWVLTQRRIWMVHLHICHIVLNHQVLGLFVMQQKLTDSHNCKGGWEILLSWAANEGITLFKKECECRHECRCTQMLINQCLPFISYLMWFM